MGLTHSDIITDVDAKCIINVNTKKIEVQSSKIVIAQYDHNSERIGFTMDRYMEGHDMSTVDRVAIKYLNVNKSDMYIVDDLALSEDGKSITFTWLVSGNATQEAGSLIFVVNFRCWNDSGAITYNWSTHPCSTYSIFKGVPSMDSNPQDLYDFWARYNSLVKDTTERVDILQDKTEVLTEDSVEMTAIVKALQPIVDDLSEDVPVLETRVNSLTNRANVLAGKVASLDRTVADDPVAIINSAITNHEEAIKLGCTENTEYTETLNEYISVTNKSIAAMSGYYTFKYAVLAGNVFVITGVSQGDAALYLFVPSDDTLETVVFPTVKQSDVTELTNVFTAPSDGTLYLCGRTTQIEPMLLVPFDNANLENKVDKEDFDKHSNALIGSNLDLTFESQYYSITQKTFVTLAQYVHATINVTKDDIYFISGSCNGDMCLYAFVGESGNVTVFPDERMGAVRYDNHTFSANENGVLYVNMCRYSDTNVWVKRTVAKEVEVLNSRVTDLENAASSSVWNGCKANFIGDSIIYGSYGDLVGMIQSRLGLSVARNYGIGGARLASSKYDGDYTPVVLSYADMDDDADIIWVAAGTNDYSTQVPIGADDSTDITTFKGALNTIMDGLREKYPDKLVVFASILHRYNDNSLNIKADEYRKAIEERCEAKHFVFYDSYRYSGFDFAKDYYDKVLTDDGLHPNEKGAEILSRKIAGFLNWQ